MPKKESSTKRKADVKNIYIEGSVKLEHGDLVGGDKFVGYTSSDVIKLFKNLSPNYRDPASLVRALNKFKNYHQALYEWKELHNDLDEILNNFGPFYSQILSLRNTPRKAMPNGLYLLWFPVAKRIGNLVIFSRSIKIIGKPFQEIDGSLLGERWAIDFYQLEKRMNDILKVAVDSGTPLIGSPYWWDELNESTGIIYATVLNYLHIGDKKLRETAMDLYDLSKEVLQS